MILITAICNFNNEPVHFWGLDDLSEGVAKPYITDIFETTLFVPGINPWPFFFSHDCSNVITYPNVNSLADAQHLLPELFYDN